MAPMSYRDDSGAQSHFFTFSPSSKSRRTAAALAPATHGLAAKISATEAKLAAKHAPAHHPGDRDSGSGASGKRYSNAAPEAQSH